LKITSKDVATNSEICLEGRIFLQQLASFKVDLLQLQNLLLCFQGSTLKIGFAWKNVSTTLKKLLGVKGSLQLHNVLSRIIPTTASKIAWASKHDLSIT
jgi:hypothetical protein